MRGRTVPLWVLIASTVASLLVGSGGVCSWKNSQVENARVEIERAKASTELREKLIDLLVEIVKFQKDPTRREQNDQEWRARIDNYNALEKNLAKLEGRQPILYDPEAVLPAAPVPISPPNGSVHVGK
jgi:hypothetical protein